jgi:hypothetical protein
MRFRLAVTVLTCATAFAAPGTPAQNRVPEPTKAFQLGELPPSPDALPPAGHSSPTKAHVYTNDNLPASRDDFNGVDFSTINDCNHQCFEQVRLLAHVSPASNPNWKRDLLQALDPVRKDSEWQGYLRQVYDAHLRFCQLGEEKREELARVADPENVTARELNVDDKFDARFREAQTSLQTLYLQQRPLQQKFAVNNFSLQFSQLQISRVQTAPCAQPRYMATGPADPDNP